MTSDFRFLMLGAMYENGGNTTHRFLDGHPQLYVYPFESQIGTRLVNDALSATFPVKYRYPVFDLAATPYQDYKAIIDEECKVRARTPHVSKFRHLPFEFSDDERCEIYQNYVQASGRSPGNNVAAFFRATFDAWKDYRRTGEEAVYVGYSPIFVVDSAKLLDDLPGAHVLHVVRNPWSAYADTKKRPVPLSLVNYMLGWTLNQYHALLFKERYPDRVHIVRAEDVMADAQKTLGAVCEKLGIETAASLKTPSWNGEPLQEVYPWGTIRKATPAANLATAQELSAAESDEIRQRTWQYLDGFDYRNFLT
ncbi:MAG: sulfotransferase [Spirulinaceae cyanobacterium RM2_2_10]|nr:sulfotransferase [Spirulinaceae cyanobacterium SM2_1_0]NJO20107.1 sulfotransferase [Spirulinaceae cyanobacterium RM2_2_10]